jgi:hypothetical protein
VEGYCWTCGWHTDAMSAPAALDPVTKMCAWCRAHPDAWPAVPETPRDLGGI